jgi:very-short-patch-repair endonuclease
MEVAQALIELGGIADASTLVSATSRHGLQQAVHSGEVIRIGRGRYSLPDLDEHPRAAARLCGALDLVSAARHYGWKVKFPPERPEVIVPRGRKVSPSRRSGIDLRWGQVSPAELAAGVITPVHTVLACAVRLPFDAAVAVADSALRAGLGKSTLLFAAERLPRTGRTRAIEVIEFADPKAANPFESALRATVRDVPGTHFEPQVWVENIGRADLVDRRRRIVLEAESVEFHTAPGDFERDLVRYNAFVCAGHLVLRFAWWPVMFDPDVVRQTIIGALAAQERSVRPCATCPAA